MQAAALLSQGPPTALGGCILGVGVSGYLFYQYIERIKSTPYDPNDWPGAKAWPSTMTLITFFILAAYMQGLLASM